ncbi:hypothetical protein F4859DRAFT_526365 [Xylaria cf. heliscus]|nr:hypothetical protein F4859DRAFT_526365 [Xylaria cf. heliscus]
MASTNDLVVIKPKGDSIITVSKTTNGIKEKRFQVSRQVAERLKLPEARCDIRLTDSDAASINTIELLLRCISENDGQSLPDEFYTVPIDEVWRVLTLVDIQAVEHFRPGQYKVPCSVLRGWFATWFKSNVSSFTINDEYEQLLYPTFVIGDPETFGTVTRRLAYDVIGQIREQSPLLGDGSLLSRSYRDMHLPKAVIRALRGAKAALRGKLIKLLDKHEQRFIGAHCPWRIQGLANFTRALLVPYDSVQHMLGNHSVQNILHNLGTIRYEEPVKSEDCPTCACDVAGKFLTESHELMNMFQGLCVNCMRLPINPVDSSTKEREAAMRRCNWHGEMTCKHSNLSPLQ